MKNAFSLNFQKHYIGQSSCAAELLYLYRQRNSVDAATCCAFAIALALRLQEAESACQVQYSTMPVVQWECFSEERVKSQHRGKLRNLFLMSKVCT